MSDFNATVANGVALNSINGGILFPLLITTVVLIAFVLIMSSSERYTWLMDTLEKFVNTLKYTAIGILTLSVLYGLYLASSVIVEVGKGIEPIWYAYAIGGYIAVTVLGRIVAKMVELLRQMHTLYRLKKERKEHAL